LNAVVTAAAVLGVYGVLYFGITYALGVAHSRALLKRALAVTRRR
jgi:hypothetical protein